MNKIRDSFLQRCALLTAACGCVAACTTTPPSLESPHVAATGFVQLDKGSSSTFTTCSAECPQASPKTIAVRARTQPTLSLPTSDLRSTLPANSPTKQPHKLAISFTSGSAQINTEASKKLKEIAANLAPGTTVNIAGRTDDVGSSMSNDALARARAAAIEKELRTELQLLKRNARITTEAKGLCCYVERNDSESGRAANRRGEVTIEEQSPQQAPRP